MEGQSACNNVTTNNQVKVLAPAKKTRKRRKKDKPKHEIASVQRAWKVGYSAAQANLPEHRNPFEDMACEEYTAWLEGWWSGFYDEPLNVSMTAEAEAKK